MTSATVAPTTFAPDPIERRTPPVTQDFTFTDDFFELKAMLKEFCDEVSPEEVVRETMTAGQGYDLSLWRRLGTELGGDGAGLVFTAGVVEELGAALLCGPVLGTLCLAVPALCALSDRDIQARYLPTLLNGEQVATLAISSPDGTFVADALTVTAENTEGGWRLSGTVEQVIDGIAADIILVPATTSAGTALFAVDRRAEGLQRTALSTLDLTRQQARVKFDSCPAELLAAESEAPEVCTRSLQTALVLMAAEQVGGSQRMLDATVGHVSSRFQFGQPVGAFQSVKHRCANMLVALEQARSAVYHAAWALQDGTDDPKLAASLAHFVASEAYLWISASAIQLHGGLGFTWEGLPHLYFKRATSDGLIFGSAADHLEVVATTAIDTLGRHA